MKPTLQLHLGQRLTMTPQLQQAIRLLQLSTVELQQEIQDALESNLMLERLGEEPDPAPETPQRGADGGADAPADSASDGDDGTVSIEEPWEAEFAGGYGFADPGDDDWSPEQAAGEHGGDLHAHLAWQLEMANLSDTDRLIALAVLDAIGDDGYLTESPEEIRDSLAADVEVELDEVEAVLHRVQRLDPVGVGARSLSEALARQLEQLAPGTPYLELARRLVCEHLETLAGQDVAGLARRLKTTPEAIREAVRLIRTLDPRPGSAISAQAAGYIIPDVIVERDGDGWRVALNPEIAPRLRINPLYARLVRRADSSSDNETLRSHMQEARWFIKSLRSRNETLLKVAGAIVERQREFFEQGQEAMRPMVLREVAEEVGMHESTISRVTTQKYMHTPRGVYEFKYFFSSHVSTTDGGECSATAIHAMIRKLVAGEDPAKPLSDSKLAEELGGRGIRVARRTIAKYREALSIPPSSERKRLM